MYEITTRSGDKATGAPPRDPGATAGTDGGDIQDDHQPGGSKLLRNAYALMLNTGISAILGLGYWLVAARYYTDEAVGQGSAAIAAMKLLAGITAVTLTGALARFIPIAGRKTRGLILRTYAGSSVVVALAAGGFLLTLGWWGPSYDILRGVVPGVGFVAAVVGWSLLTLQDGVLTGLRRAVWVPVGNTVFSVGKLALLVGLAAAVPATGVYVSWAGAIALSVLLLGWLVFRRLVPAHVRVTEETARPVSPREIGRFLAGDSTGALFSLAVVYLVPVLVAAQVSSADNAYFYITITVAGTINLLAVNMGASLTVESSHSPERLAENCRASLSRMARLMLPVCGALFFFAPQILGVFGPGYADAATPLLRWLAVGALLRVVIEVYYAVLRVRSRTSPLAALQGLLCALVLGLTMLLLPRMGLTGAGVAEVASLALIAAYAGWRLRPVLRETPAPQPAPQLAPQSSSGTASATGSHAATPASYGDRDGAGRTGETDSDGAAQHPEEAGDADDTLRSGDDSTRAADDEARTRHSTQAADDETRTRHSTQAADDEARTRDSAQAGDTAADRGTADGEPAMNTRPGRALPDRGRRPHWALLDKDSATLRLGLRADVDHPERRPDIRPPFQLPEDRKPPAPSEPSAAPETASSPPTPTAPASGPTDAAASPPATPPDARVPPTDAPAPPAHASAPTIGAPSPGAPTPPPPQPTGEAALTDEATATGKSAPTSGRSRRPAGTATADTASAPPSRTPAQPAATATRRRRPFPGVGAWVPGGPALALWLLFGTALGLYWLPLRGMGDTELDAMGDLGLITVLPVPTLLGAALLAVVFAGCLVPGRERRGLLPATLLATVFCLHAVPALLESEPRFATGWQHLGFLDYIDRTGATAPELDARWSWPGFFAAAAFVAQACGVEDLTEVVRWWPVISELLLLAPLALLLSAVRAGWRAKWCALWFFALCGWVGQDYFSPQSFTFFLYLCFAAVLVVWFREAGEPSRAGAYSAPPEPGTPPNPQTARTPPQAAGPQAPKSPETSRTPRPSWLPWTPRARRKKRKNRLDGESPVPAAGSPLRVVLLAVLVGLFVAALAAHQLTPFVMLGVLTILVLVRRSVLRGLPLLFGVLLAVWIGFLAEPYWSGHLEELFGGVGGLGDNLSSSVSGRIQGGSELHKLVLYARVALAGGTMALAGLGLLRRLRRGVSDRSLLVLTAVPFLALGLQSYGGEMALRVFLFALPGACVLAALAFFPRAFGPHVPGSALQRMVAPVAALLAGLVLMGGFFVARWGNETFERVLPGEVAAMEYVYAHDRPTARVLWLSSDPQLDVTPAMPWGARDMERVRYVPTLAPRDPQRVGSLVDELSEAGPQSYLMVNRGQSEYLRLDAGYQERWEQRLRRSLDRRPELRRVYADEHAALYELREQPPGAVAEADAGPSGPLITWDSWSLMGAMGAVVLTVALAAREVVRVTGADPVAARRRSRWVVWVSSMFWFALPLLCLLLASLVWRFITLS